MRQRYAWVFSWKQLLHLRTFRCRAVSYVDDCRDDDATTTQVLAESDGYLAVFPRHERTSSATRQSSSTYRRCPWVLSVDSGRRINITWRVSPSPLRYKMLQGSSDPSPDGRTVRRHHDHDQEPCSSLKLIFIEAGYKDVHWTCHRQDTAPVDRSTQV